MQTAALDLVDEAVIWAHTTRGARLIVSMPPQEGKPVIIDAVILMGDGSRRRLADVRVGDTVITHLGRPKRVTAVHEQGTLPVVTLTTHAGRVVTAALDHPFLTPEGWVNAGDLKVGDTLAAVPNAKTTANATLTHEAARLLGYFVGDGNTTQSAQNLNAVVTCADDIEAADLYHCAEVLGFEIGVGSTRTTSRAKAYLFSKGVRPWLRMHGLAGCTSWTKRVPQEIYRQPNEVIAEFVGAYYACDGTVSRRGGARPDARLEFNSVSRDLLADVQHLLLRLGIATTLRAKNTTFNGKPYVSWRLLMRRQDDVAKFRALVPVHHAKAKVLADWPLQRTSFDAPYFADPIMEIATGEEAECRCLTVEDDHTFTAEDLVVHNSERVTKTGSLWALTRNPDTRIGIVSYAQPLAEGFGRDIRNWVASNNGDEGTFDIGLRIAADNGSAKRWQLSGYRGGIVCVGISSGLTGKPLDALVIDDPIADEKQAESAAWRDRVWRWWQAVGSTRLAPGAPVIVILTRWHEDDLAGRLLAAEDGHRWKVVNIPAQADYDPAKGESDPLGRQPGEWLASARERTLEDWEQIRVQAGTRVFTALYQGRPSPDAGNVWKRPWWRRYSTLLWSQHPTLPDAYLVHEFDELIMSWDMAFKDTKSSDFVVGQVWCRRGADVYLLDQIRKRMTFTETVTAFKAMTGRWPQVGAKLVEDKANGTAVISTLQSKIPGIIPITPTESKYARANAVAPMVEAGNVHLPDPTIALFDPEELIEEAAGFPNAAHDDQVDATSQALSRLLINNGSAQQAMDWLRQMRETTDPPAA